MKHLSHTVLAALLCAALVSCAAEAPPTVSTEAPDTSAAGTAVTEAETARMTVTPTSTDYDGYEFHIINFDNALQHAWVGIPNDIDVEEETGDVLNDAVYVRNRAVEEALNVTISVENVTADVVTSKVRQSVMAGAEDYDLAFPQLLSWQALISGQLVYDLYDLEALDFSMPWWDRNMMDELTYHGHLFGAVSDITYIDKLSCFTVFFNKEMAQQYDVGNLYESVTEGSWTYERMLSLSSDISADFDGNSVYDEKDKYGICSQNDLLYITLHSAGISFCDNENETIVFGLDGERALEVLGQTFEIMNDTRTFFNRQAFNLSMNDAINMLMDDRTLFMIRPLQTVMNLRSMKADFGVLPIPKYDEAQKNYNTALNVWTSTILTVPRDARELDRTADVVNLLACESYYTVIEPFYDLVLDSKLVRDDETAPMLDIIFDSRFYDIGLICNFGSIFEALLARTNDAAASVIEANRNKVMHAAEEFLDAIADYE